MLSLKFKKLGLLYSISFALSLSTAHAGVLNDNVDLRYYIDFANNTGFFKPGAQNIPIYYKSKTLSDNTFSNGYVNNGILKSMIADGVPMPDFSAVFKYQGSGTLVDPQYTQSNKHTTSNKGWFNTYGSVRHYDAINLENSTKRTHSGSLGNDNWSQYAANINSDPKFKAFWADQADLDISRVSKLVTDVAPAKLMDFGQGAIRYNSSGNRIADNKSPVIVQKYNAGDLTHFYRLGGGQQIDTNGKLLANSTDFLTGGVYENPNSRYIASHINSFNKTTWLISKFEVYTARDSALGLPLLTRGGDSGSPIFAYDKTTNEWYVLGTLWGSVNSNGGFNVYSALSASELEYYKKFFQAGTIINSADQSLEWKNGTLTQSDHDWSYKTLSSSEIDKLPNNISNENLNNTQDIIFSGGKTNILVKENINTGAGSVTFNNDYSVEGVNDDISYVGSGLIVNKGTNVTWKLKGVAGDNLHKIGEGTLVVNGTGVNKGGLRVGDGTVVLKQQKDANGKVEAFSSLIIASGRPTVVLGDSNQIAGKNITFVYRGGTLDLNGNNIVFDRIRHVDDGATITNRNMDLKSNLNITGGVRWSDGRYKQIYKGFFGERTDKTNGAMDVNFKSDIAGDTLALTGGANINGDINVSKGSLILNGSPVFFSTLYNDNIAGDAKKLGLINNYIQDIVDMKTYKADNYTVSNNGKFEIGHHTNVFGTIKADHSDVIVGKVTSKQNTVCFDVENAKLPTCSSNNNDLLNLYSFNTLDTYFTGDVYLSNQSNYTMGLSYVVGSIYDTDNNSSLKIENNAKFIVKGVNNNINTLNVSDSTIILGNNEYSRLKADNFYITNSTVIFNVDYKNNLSSYLSVNQSKDSNIELVVNALGSDIALDYTRDIELINIATTDNTTVKLKGDIDGIDIGLYKFKLNHNDSGDYYLSLAKGVQKQIISNATNSIITGYAASNNLIERHMFFTKDNFRNNETKDGFWFSNSGRKIWYKSDNSYRNFNQKFWDINFGYNRVLDNGNVSFNFSHINSSTNNSVSINANYFDIYGKYNLSEKNSLYAIASFGQNDNKFTELGERIHHRNFVQTYVLGGERKLYDKGNLLLSAYGDVSLSSTKYDLLKFRNLNIQYNNHLNSMVEAGLKAKYRLKSSKNYDHQLILGMSYKQNIRKNNKVDMNSHEFIIENNKSDLSFSSGYNITFNEKLSGFVSTDYSIGTNYKPSIGFNVGGKINF